MHSVNIHLKLSGEQQLKFLEEVISLLHCDPGGDSSSDGTASVGAHHSPRHFEHKTNSARATQESQTSEEHLQRCRSSELLHLKGIPSSYPTSAKSFSDFRPHRSKSILPRPPSSSPPPQSASRFHRARRVVRPPLQKQHSIDADHLEIDPYLYLNEAELALISSQQTPSLSSWTSPHALYNSSWLFSRRSSRSELADERHMHKSECWLKESDRHQLQEWLSKKDRECYLKKKEKLRQQKQKQKQREIEADRARERAEQAKEAYRQWLEKKQANYKKMKTPSLEIHTPLRRTVSQVQSKRQKGLCNPVQKRFPVPGINPITTLARKKKALPLREQAQPVHSTLPVKQRTSFEEWLQAKNKEKRAVKRRTKSETPPKDLQRIAKDMQKVRLQQKEYSKKHVDTGIVKHRTTADCSKAAASLQTTA